MVDKMLGIQEKHLNELYALLERLKRAFVADRFDIILEMDNEDSYWEWRNVVDFGVVAEHKYVEQQLTQQGACINFNLTVRPLKVINANLIAVYSTRHGVETWDHMINIPGPFGRVFEL